MMVRAWSSVLGCTLSLAFIGCSATSGDRTGNGVDNGANTGSGASNSSGGMTPVLGGNVGTGATPNLGGGLSPGGGSENPAACQSGGVEFVPKVPTVLLMVDRSGTMFKDPGGNPWATLRDGVLEVVKDMASEVRFGLLAVTGEGNMCPLLDEVAPAKDNYDALAAKYTSLTAPLKGESPGMRGMARASEILEADTVEGDKYVLFVTDGEQDYCNDGNFACPTDSMVQTLQSLATKGFKTFIFGLPMASDDPAQQQRYPAVLQAFADAGAGVTVAPVLPPGGAAPIDIFYNCGGVPEWKAEATALGRADMQTLGTYGATSGGAAVFAPDPTNKEALKEAFAKVLSGVKSCTFDLGGDIKVVQSLLSQAHVYVQGVEVPLDLTKANGWHMPTPTQIELVGDACTNWRMPKSTKIDWDFPCQILEPR
jgi:hypothetical protein